MSFNTLCGGHQGTIHDLEVRKPKILAAIRREDPDIIGCQEVVDDTRVWLEQALFPEYAMLGCGREANNRGEGCPVLYKKSRFALLGFDTFWLSDTPDVPGSKFRNLDQSWCPRFAHCLRLRQYEDGKEVLFVNTHLDHEGEKAREQGLSLIFDRIFQMAPNTLGVLTGDFNVTPDAPYFQAFLSKIGPMGWKDATANIEATFHDFGRCDPPTKIDYIITNAQVLSSKITEDPRTDGGWYSDHNAVAAELEI